MTTEQLLKHLRERNTMLDREAIATINRLRQILREIEAAIDTERPI